MKTTLHDKNGGHALGPDLFTKTEIVQQVQSMADCTNPDYCAPGLRLANVRSESFLAKYHRHRSVQVALQNNDVISAYYEKFTKSPQS